MGFVLSQNVVVVVPDIPTPQPGFAFWGVTHTASCPRIARRHGRGVRACGVLLRCVLLIAEFLPMSPLTRFSIAQRPSSLPACCHGGARPESCSCGRRGTRLQAWWGKVRLALPHSHCATKAPRKHRGGAWVWRAHREERHLFFDPHSYPAPCFLTFVRRGYSQAFEGGIGTPRSLASEWVIGIRIDCTTPARDAGA